MKNWNQSKRQLKKAQSIIFICSACIILLLEFACLNLLTHKLPMICVACFQRNDRRLCHFLLKWMRAALIVSFADKGKLLRDSCISVLITASSTFGIELSDWWSRISVSDFKANLPLLALEPIQFNQNFAAKDVNASPSTLANSNLSVTNFVLGTSFITLVNSDSFCDHKPALVI